ncbi:uncharacterized protein LOC130806469 isoform X2 [Amaranthus tricolor]|uniref:uncharacterized protein LOC130806469 isoform X2 n=1 Tax=Amaranthus tricolor TaxID=29722 RepID=UPI0025835E3C|nr:uncharacterized protein LOC130806469 isoform X2 [Amaranthus tricolor]
MDVATTNSDTNPTNLPETPLIVRRRLNKKGLPMDDSDESSSVRITPHYEPIKAGDESSVSPIYPPEIMKTAPWEVSIAFFPNYLPRINPDLEGLLYVDMENLEGSAESSGRESAAPAPPPFYIPDGGPLNYFIDVQTKRDLDNRREAISQKWGLKDNINIITPGNYDTVRFPPPHCIAVYFPSFELGLRFPLHPFFREVLEFLDVSVPELYPNAWGCMVAFLILCKVLAVPPTLTAFRYIFRARLCNSQSYGCGWITFTHRRGLKIVQDLPDNQKGYRTKFAYLYNSEGWNIKTSFDIKPNLSGFNNGIPQCSFNDAVIIEYAKMDVQLGRKPMNVQLNWIPGRPELENENLLSAFGISLAIDRRIAKQNLRAKSPELMKKFSVLRLASGAIQRAEDKPLPLPPKDSATVEKGLEDVPSEQEALRLLEERKQVHIPDESERVVPPQTRGATKKSGKKKRKRDSSSHKEKSAKRPSVGAVPTARPLQIRPVEEETSPLQDSPRPSSDKGKEKMGESSAAPSSQYAEVYRRREVSPFRRDTPFPELGHKGLVVRFNRATSNLISKVDVDLLESMPPRDRVRQAQASAAEAFIRLAFELDANRQSAADQETMAALTSRCEELNEELTKLREDLPSLKEKLAKCSELKERLVRTEQWRERARKQLDQIVENLDAASTRSASISHEVGLLMDTHAKLVHQNQQLMQQVSADSSHFKMILSAAKVYKLCLTRKARIARDWLLSDEPEASKFLGDLTAEMVKAGTMISDEKYRLAAAELGMDFTSLQQTAEQKGSEALSNLAPVLDGESAVLVDTVWDATEKRAWSEKINAEAEREALSLDLEQLALSSPPASDVPENLTLSNLEVLCLDLSNLIIDEGRNLQSLSRELSEIGVEPFNVEDYVSFTPSFEEGRIESPPPPGEDVEAFFDDV